MFIEEEEVQRRIFTVTGFNDLMDMETLKRIFFFSHLISKNPIIKLVVQSFNNLSQKKERFAHLITDILSFCFNYIIKLFKSQCSHIQKEK